MATTTALAAPDGDSPGGLQLSSETLFSLVTNGDCSKLSPAQRVEYYRVRCEAAGIDPRTKPFEFLNLNGKLVLYALKGATDQLAANHGITCEVVEQKTETGVRTVTVRSRTRDGRQTDEIGCVSVGGLSGDALCNAFMKAVTKAKRRAVLSLCGLGMLDETELETIKSKAPVVATEPAPLAPTIMVVRPANAKPPKSIADYDVRVVSPQESMPPLATVDAEAWEAQGRELLAEAEPTGDWTRDRGFNPPPEDELGGDDAIEVRQGSAPMQHVAGPLASAVSKARKARAGGDREGGPPPEHDPEIHAGVGVGGKGGKHGMLFAKAFAAAGDAVPRQAVYDTIDSVLTGHGITSSWLIPWKRGPHGFDTVLVDIVAACERLREGA